MPKRNNEKKSFGTVSNIFLNSASALWSRDKKDITDDQYKEFYHHVGMVYDDPWLILHNKAEGLRTDFYENGNKEFEAPYKDGKLNGLGISWYENGQKKSTGHFKNGEKDGLWSYWDEDGKKISEKHFVDGNEK